jgi:NADH:ubiquinone reductase (non-electrogenic)
MAVRSLLIRPKAVSSSTMQLSSLSRRSLSHSSRVHWQGLRAASSPLIRSPLRQPVQRSFRRSYADSAPEPEPKSRFRYFRYFRWAYRLTLVSGLGLTAYLGYHIYDLNHPAEQADPAPDKKTLVVLGKCYGQSQQRN